MSKYISKTKSKIIFKEIAEKEIENLKQGDPMTNKILADIIARREALRAQQAQRSAEKQRMLQAIHNHKASAPQSKLDEFEKEYEAFIAEQRRLKEEREAKEAATKEVEVPVDVPVEEVKDDVNSEKDIISENTKEVQIVETKPKKKTKKKTVVEATETVE